LGFGGVVEASSKTHRRRMNTVPDVAPPRSLKRAFAEPARNKSGKGGNGRPPEITQRYETFIGSPLTKSTMRSGRNNSRKSIGLESRRRRRLAFGPNHMNPKRPSIELGSDKKVAHTAKPANLDAVVRALGVTSRELRETKELIRNRSGLRQFVHAR
jgi:hypothetical protein